MKPAPITRRRAITMLATAFGGMAAGPATSRAGTDYAWSGFAMGADARIIFSGGDVRRARRVAGLVVTEIERLEGALSLYREDSEICRLNRDGALRSPTGDMIRALALAVEISRATNGLFDPTVQPLWEVYADWFAQFPRADAPPQTRLAHARAVIDWRRIGLAAGSIALGGGQRLTLNGIAQGYVTDRIGDLLRAHGYDHVLIDLGEQRALGPRRDGSPWRIERPGAADIPLASGALATSEGAGCVLGAAGAVHHLFDPRTGRSAAHWRRLTVRHRSAAVADGLSTALYAASPAELAALLGRIEGATVWTTDQAGGERRWHSTAAADDAASEAAPPAGRSRARP